jgi:uncharacterized membrane protein
VFAAFKERAGQLALIGLLMLVASIVIVIALIIVIAVMFGGAFMQSMGDEQAMLNLMMEHGLSMLALIVLVALGLFVPLSMAYWFAPALVVFHQMDALPAMRQSFMGCLRNIVPFLLYGIIFLGLGILALITIGLGLLVIVPMAYGSWYAAYKDIYLKD